jgi:hypothetical protein
LNLRYINSIFKIIINNELAIKLEENSEFYKRFKYIDIVYYFIRENIQ